MKRQNIVGPQIRKLRYNKDWSAARLAVELCKKGLEVEREFVAQIEAQIHCVKDKDLLYFASALNVSVVDLYPKIDPACSLHKTIAKLLEEKPNGHPSPIVMNSLQLVASKNGK